MILTGLQIFLGEKVAAHTQATRPVANHREEKPLPSRCHGSQKKFLDDNKPKNHLKSIFALFQTSPILFNFVCQMLAKFSGVESEGIVPKIRKRKETFRLVFTYSVKRAREIRKFHVAVLQRRLKNVQKSVMHVQSCCFTNVNLLLFCRSRCRCRRCSLPRRRF